MLGALGDDQRLSPSVVVKDAGSGLAAGVSAAWPDAEERDDLFHAVYQVGREAAHLERRAYKAIGTVEDLGTRLRRTMTEAKRSALETELAQAHERMTQSIDRYDRYEALRRQTRRMLALTERGSGELRSSSEVTDALTIVADEMLALGGRRILKIATYLRNRAAGLARYLDALQQRLDAVAEAAGPRRRQGAPTGCCRRSLPRPAKSRPRRRHAPRQSRLYRHFRVSRLRGRNCTRRQSGAMPGTRAHVVGPPSPQSPQMSIEPTR